MVIQVLNARGRLVAQAANQVNLPSARAGTAYQVKLLAAGNAAASGTVLSIGLKPATAAIHKTAKPRHLDAEYRGPQTDGGRAHASMQTQLAGNRLSALSRRRAEAILAWSPVASADRLMHLASPRVKFPSARWRSGHAGISQPGET